MSRRKRNGSKRNTRPESLATSAQPTEVPVRDLTRIDLDEIDREWDRLALQAS